MTRQATRRARWLVAAAIGSAPAPLAAFGCGPQVWSFDASDASSPSNTIESEDGGAPDVTDAGGKPRGGDGSGFAVDGGGGQGNTPNPGDSMPITCDDFGCACNDDRDCASGFCGVEQRCVQCVVTDAGSRGCQNLEFGFCANERCVQGCLSTQTCVRGRCNTNPDSGGPGICISCTNDQDCAPGDVCDTTFGQCVECTADSGTCDPSDTCSQNDLCAEPTASTAHDP